jgi:hypothetical protein
VLQTPLQTSLQTPLPPSTLSVTPSAAPPVGLSGIEQATLDEVKRRAQDGDEVILIVRSRRNPQTRSDVIVLDSVSEHFFDALTGRESEWFDQDRSAQVILSSHGSQSTQMPPFPSIVSPMSGPQPVSFPVRHSTIQ